MDHIVRILPLDGCYFYISLDKIIVKKVCLLDVVHIYLSSQFYVLEAALMIMAALIPQTNH